MPPLLHPDRPSTTWESRRDLLVALLFAALVLASFAPLLQGCGDDLVVGGMVIPRTPTTTGPTATPDPNDNDDDF